MHKIITATIAAIAATINVTGENKIDNATPTASIASTIPPNTVVKMVPILATTAMIPIAIAMLSTIVTAISFSPIILNAFPTSDKTVPIIEPEMSAIGTDKAIISSTTGLINSLIPVRASAIPFTKF
jgi:hypothetical protein